MIKDSWSCQNQSKYTIFLILKTDWSKKFSLSYLQFCIQFFKKQKPRSSAKALVSQSNLNLDHIKPLLFLKDDHQIIQTNYWWGWNEPNIFTSSMTLALQCQANLRSFVEEGLNIANFFKWLIFYLIH
jgi:hypothetical protein